MQTMGTVVVQIKEAEDKDPIQVLVLGIREKAYPQHIGEEICKALGSEIVTEESNIFKAILLAFKNFPNDSSCKGKECIYTLTIQPYKLSIGPNSLLGITEFDVLMFSPMKIGELNKGGPSDFRDFCKFGVATSMLS